MDCLNNIKNLIPDWAKDLRLNLDGTIARSSLSAEDALGVALASAFAAKNKYLVDQFKSALNETDANAALTAASLMGMNNVYYPYPEMAGDSQLQNMPAKLRMNAYRTHGDIDKVRFEVFGLAASIIGKCEFCVKAHYKAAKDGGLSSEQLQDIGRIASVVNAVSQVLVAEGH